MTTTTRGALGITHVRSRTGLQIPRGYLPGPAHPRQGGRFRWARWLIPLAALFTSALLLWGWTHPSSLASARLEGTRGPGCLRLVIAADVSGSMSRIAAPRDAAVTQVLRWAPGNLRPDDEVVLLDFAGSAALRAGPTSIGDPVIPTSAQPDLSGTQFEPVLARVAGLPSGRCRTALLLLSDGQMSDLPVAEPDATSQLTAAGIHRIDLIVPGITDVNPGWSSLYPSAPPEVFDGADPDATAVTIARHIAGATGQNLRTTS